MNILVIGGTRFVGLAIVQELLARGHTVFVFHRGLTVPPNMPGAQFLIGDRDTQLAALRDSEVNWDITIGILLIVFLSAFATRMCRCLWISPWANRQAKCGAARKGWKICVYIYSFCLF